MHCAKITICIYKALMLDITELIRDFADRHRLPIAFETMAKQVFVPLAESLIRQVQTGHAPLLVGINGCQGSGKSTLTDFLVFFLKHHHGTQAIGMSIDDFYLTLTQRKALSQSIHPLLRTRGVPGTHDTGLMQQTLRKLIVNDLPVAIPRFAKASDDRTPADTWPTVSDPVQIILFEGWCVGAQAQTRTELTRPVNQLEATADANMAWRLYVNRQLSDQYQQVFALLDRLVMLKAPGFHSVKQWRIEQEERLAEQLERDGGSAAALMSRAQVENFIEYYQRITESCLRDLPGQAHDLIELNDQRGLLTFDLGRGLDL
jgi:D-glycerate 3-kinase